MRYLLPTIIAGFITLTTFNGMAQCHLAVQNITEDFNNPVSCWTFTARNNIAENFTGVSNGVLRMLPRHIGSLAVLPRVYNASGVLSFDISGLGHYQVGVMASPGDGGSFTEISSGTINTSGTVARTVNFGSYTGTYQYIAILVTNGPYSNGNISVDDLSYISGCPSTDFPVFNINENITVDLDASGNGSLSVGDVDVSSVTSCGHALSSLSLDQTAFTCSDLGVNNVNLTAEYNGNPIGVLSVPVTVEDNLAPIAAGQNITVPVDANTGLGMITADMVENGSTDNCDSNGDLIKSLSKSIFRCEDTGDNLVTLTVEDASGNISTTEVTVTVTSDVTDESITAANANFCPDGTAGSTISTGSSVVGFNYTLRNSASNAIVDGPYAGTGSAIDFATGNLSETTTFNVLTEKVRTPTQTALAFDGVNDYVYAGTDNRGITTEVSIAAWVKTTASVVKIMVAKYDGTNGFYLQMNANGTAILYGRDGSGAKNSGSSTTTINDDEWHYVVGTANLATGNWRIYIDGIQENGVTNSTGATLASPANFYIGAQSAIYFPGSLDQVTVWNMELGAADILSHFTSCLTGTETGIVGHFIFEDGSGTTLTDQSPSAIDGTLSGMDDADWIDVISPSCAAKACEYQMVTEVTIGDNTPPTAIAQAFTLLLGSTGSAALSVADIDNGSSDNCTAAGNLMMTLDKTEFTCEDIGTNTVTLTVTDEEGNVSTANATVTVTTVIEDEAVTISETELCPSGASGTTVSVASSVVGVNYYLRNSSDDSVLDGPIAGTGSALDFSTGSTSTSTTFNVLAESEGLTRDYLDFDGVDDQVNAGNDNRGISQELTVSAWIKTSASTTQAIAQKYDGTNGLLMYLHTSGAVAITAGDGNAYKTSNFSTTAVNDNEWHYVTGTINISTGFWAIYVDGVLENSTMNVSGATLATTADLIIGSYSTFFFEGAIDQLTFWNTALDQATIQSYMANGITGSESNLVGYFPFDETAGTTATDASATAIHASLTNMDPSTDWLSEHTPGCQLEMSTEVSITIADNTDPNALTQDITIALDANGDASIAAADIDNGSSDNCSTVTLSLSSSTFTCADLGANTVTLTAEDGSGNQSTATATVTVVDTTAPTVASQNLSVALDATGHVTVDPASINTSSSDNCSATLTFDLSQTAYDCTDVGDNTVAFSVTDESGNTATQNVTITITDAAPTAVAQNITVELDANGAATISPSDIDNGSMDDCTTALDLVMSLDVTSFDCEDIGTPNPVTLSVTDLHGNTTTATATVTVVDLLAPTASTQDITIVLDESGNASIAPADINSGSSDNCTAAASLILSLDVTTFDTNDLGPNTVTLTVTDAHGHTDTGTATVTVSDKELQTATFTGMMDKVFGDPNFDIVATTDNGLPATFTVTSGNLSIVSSTTHSATVSVDGAGVAMISVSNSGDDTYAPLQETITITVDKADQILAIENVTDQSMDASPLAINASVNSGLTLDYAVTGPASLLGNIITLDGTLGTVEVTVSQTGNSNYHSVSEAIRFDVVEKQAQTLVFTDIPDLTYGALDQSMTATASSGLSVDFHVISGPAVLNGSTLSITGTGTVVVEATQAGDTDFLAAVAQQSFVVSKAPLTIIADDLSITYGDAIPSLTFTYVGLVNGESGNDLLSEPTLTTTTNNASDAGTYPITLSGGASDNYEISLQDGALTIDKADQIISIDQIADKAPTDVDFDVVASATSGLALTYDISGPVTITGTTISLHGTHGTVTLTVTQAGDINHNAASESITFEVQVITDVSAFDTAIRIYPNPAVHELVITGAEHSAVKMFSLDGKLVKQVTLSHQKLNIGDLENGTYLVEVSQGQERVVRKVVKVN
ncbi:hypothetical protein BFP72_06075 [Reichenbachiella sp. 5M10]|uniref:LamG-like jellyroll fold domain-containing protein n=1 Tax=Reichenbachiella sp. 5M10 TaxID=1889772 RepID=UPI000C1490B2|nr:LamG-like jellyroll fold domain-containing protein [Reichenbachiella sp. 5M10]PIB34989.1 hypothetical protein BFP72_06075 [Reichenbachiella sp. 5M10]